MCFGLHRFTRIGDLKLLRMASVGTLPSSTATRKMNDSVCVDKLPEGINEMKIKDDKVRRIFTFPILWTY